MPESIWIVVCRDGARCSAWLNRGFWQNAARDKESAEASLLELDRPDETEWAKKIDHDDPEKFKLLTSKGIFKPHGCGPHKVVEYRPVER